MRRTTILIIALAIAMSCMVGVVVVNVYSQARAADETPPEPPAAAANTVAESLTSPEAYGLPSQMTRLTDFQRLDQATLSKPEQTDVLVWWLAQERANPSLPTTGLGGGRIDSGYIQAQIIIALSHQGDPKVMTTLVESDAISDQGVRDGVICALGMMGDASRIPRLLEILETHKEGDFRAMAARALGDLAAAEAAEALNRARTDGFAVQAGSDVGPRRLWVKYPVRQAAVGALRMLNSEERRAKAQQRREAFAESMNRGPAESTAPDGD